jgi:hypothetical protein
MIDSVVLFVLLTVDSYRTRCRVLTNLSRKYTKIAGGVTVCTVWYYCIREMEEHKMQSIDAAAAKITQNYISKGRQSYFYDEQTSQTSWFLPPADIESLVRSLK